MTGGKIIAILVVVATLAGFGMALVMKQQTMARRARLQAPRAPR